jgi:hypothetical protein
VAPSFQPPPPTNYQVSIVYGASTMADKAFSPNPINSAQLRTIPHNKKR